MKIVIELCSDASHWCGVGVIVDGSLDTVICQSIDEDRSTVLENVLDDIQRELRKNGDIK